MRAAVALATTLALCCGPATAETNDGDCASFLREAFSQEGAYYNYGRWRVMRTRVTARSISRDYHGFLSYSKDRYFEMRPIVGGGFEGTHEEVFSDRDEGQTDRTTVEITRSGDVKITLNSWGNSEYTLTGVSCFSGHNGKEFILTGYHRSASQGVQVNTFLIQPCSGSRGCEQ